MGIGGIEPQTSCTTLLIDQVYAQSCWPPQIDCFHQTGTRPMTWHRLPIMLLMMTVTVTGTGTGSATVTAVTSPGDRPSPSP